MERGDQGPGWLPLPGDRGRSQVPGGDHGQEAGGVPRSSKQDLLSQILRRRHQESGVQIRTQEVVRKGGHVFFVF